ncbi:MAG: IS21 family transposase [Dethiobacteria bacterium]
MPQQEYIKYLYETEELSINEISAKVGVNWRTAAKYAKRDDWNPVQATGRRRRPILEPFIDTIDVWLLEDRLLPRKDRRTAKAIWKQLRKDHGFTGSERTVRAYVSERKKALKYEQQEKYIELEHSIGDAQVDFGTVRTILDGELKEFRSLTTAFPWSNAGFGVPVPSENSLCFLYALRLSFEMAGGVPRNIRFDNLPAVVTCIGKNGERVLSEMFICFMLHYRFHAEFCNIGKGNEKGAVENKVGYSRRNWYVPFLQTTGFEELTAEIYKQALEDLERPHYKKGVLISELWAEEKTNLLPLPAEPFEPVEFQTVKVNKYGKVTVDKESYALPGACIGETILAKLWWDKIEMLDQNQKCLAIFPRPYTLKRKPIDWPGHFAIFVRKPKGARNSILYRFLPPAVKSYLEVEPEAFRERINFSHTLLQEGYEMSFIDEALEKAGASRINDQAMIWHLLYSLSNRDKTNSGLDDDYSPPSVKNYLPLIEEYDQLMPSGKGGAYFGTSGQ